MGKSCLARALKILEDEEFELAFNAFPLTESLKNMSEEEHIASGGLVVLNHKMKLAYAFHKAINEDWNIKGRLFLYMLYLAKSDMCGFLKWFEKTISIKELPENTKKLFHLFNKVLNDKKPPKKYKDKIYKFLGLKTDQDKLSRDNDRVADLFFRMFEKVHDVHYKESLEKGDLPLTRYVILNGDLNVFSLDSSLKYFDLEVEGFEKNFFNRNPMLNVYDVFSVRDEDKIFETYEKLVIDVQQNEFDVIYNRVFNNLEILDDLEQGQPAKVSVALENIYKMIKIAQDVGEDYNKLGLPLLFGNIFETQENVSYDLNEFFAMDKELIMSLFIDRLPTNFEEQQFYNGLTLISKLTGVKLDFFNESDLNETILTKEFKNKRLNFTQKLNFIAKHANEKEKEFLLDCYLTNVVLFEFIFESENIDSLYLNLEFSLQNNILANDVFKKEKVNFLLYLMHHKKLMEEKYLTNDLHSQEFTFVNYLVDNHFNTKTLAENKEKLKNSQLKADDVKNFLKEQITYHQQTKGISPQGLRQIQILDKQIENLIKEEMEEIANVEIKGKGNVEVIYNRKKNRLDRLSQIYDDKNNKENDKEKDENNLSFDDFIHPSLFALRKELLSENYVNKMFEVEEEHLPLVPYLNEMLLNLFNGESFFKYRYEENVKDFVRLNVTKFLSDLVDGRFYKPFVKIDKDNVLKALEELKEDCANFSEVIDYYKAQVLRNNFNDFVKPILLIGESGTGKSYFVKKLSQIFKFDNFKIDMPTITSVEILLGFSSTYKASKEGVIFRNLFKNNSANNFVVLEELDKIQSNGYGLSQNDLLLLLEKETREEVYENFLNTEINTKGIVYIATANSLVNVNPAMLSRFHVFNIKKPANIKYYIKKSFDKYATALNIENKFDEIIVPSVLETLENLDLRKLDLCIENLINQYVLKKEISESEFQQFIKTQKEIDFLTIENPCFEIIDYKDIDVCFDDIKGLKEIKEQTKEMLNLFLNKDKLIEFGVKPLKGVVFEGDAGCGKTMLAKAFAKEAKTSFIYINAANIGGKYIGDGAKQIKQLFEKARNLNKCVIFIDEMDALGNRNDNSRGRHSDQDNIINALLTQLDGVNSNDDIFVIGATNFYKRLDEALVRAGRIDKSINFRRPYLEERLDFLLSVKDKYSFGDNVDLEHLAKISMGASFADLDNIIKQAALIAIRKNENEIRLEHLSEAYEEILLGVKTVKEKEEAKYETAVHEIGHALVAEVLGYAKLNKVTVVPRQSSLGVTIYYHDDDKLNQSREDMLNNIAVTLAGREAERVVLGKTTTGASSDIRKASKMARDFVVKYGFSENENISSVLYDDFSILSEKMKQEIEKEIAGIINTQAIQARNIIMKNKEGVEKLAQKLCEEEVLYSLDVA